METTITLSLDDWMTIRKTLNRGLEGYSEDLQFLIKATTVMNLKKRRNGDSDVTGKGGHGTGRRV
jgi:hypothetical protein